MHGTHTVSYAEQIGLGSQQYTLIDVNDASAVNGLNVESSHRYNVYSLDGKKLLTNAASLDGLQKGTYIINGEKRVLQESLWVMTRIATAFWSPDDQASVIR